MPSRPFTKLINAPFTDVVTAAQISESAGAIAARAQGVNALVDALAAQSLHDDAVRVLAVSLMPREAVWWAALAAHAAMAVMRKPGDADALAAAEAWVYKPTEENRRAAMAKAQSTQFDSAGAWAAVAAFWSGGSMAPPNAPVVPPPPFLIARAVIGAVTLAAVAGPPDKIPGRYAQLVAQGIDIAAGGNGRIAAPG
ncbi:MAG: hypothetical protein JNL66_00245 [Alphaproteobacteria bacterium]|nr:hypothetical protein [Alphaproteobacteria bacterium]